MVSRWLSLSQNVRRSTDADIAASSLATFPHRRPLEDRWPASLGIFLTESASVDMIPNPSVAMLEMVRLQFSE